MLLNLFRNMYTRRWEMVAKEAAQGTSGRYGDDTATITPRFEVNKELARQSMNETKWAMAG